jgi:hypothetical protein
MRNITTHVVSEADQLKIVAKGVIGPGGAENSYVIEVESPELDETGYRCEINFQNGPIPINGTNGVTIEALLAVSADRLEMFQSGPYPCEENGRALEHIKLALADLKLRTRNRIARGVEGKITK